ncbi:MAG: recombinase family protein [Oscillospiraceae bacterium]
MKVAIYCRLSEEDKNKTNENDESNSIQNQKSLLTEYSLEHNWEISKIYSDDDYAGSDRNRPEFQKLLADAKAHKFDIILCKTQSRFTREMEIVEKYINGFFPMWNIRFISVVDNADTAIKGNKKSRQINGLINEWYLEDMSDNIKSVLTNRRRNGLHIGSFALYGYLKDSKIKGSLAIDDTAANVVRRIFSLYAQGYGKSAIARILNDEGIPNPTEYKRLCGLNYKQPKSKSATLWKYFAISNILSNEIYTGNMVQGKYGSVSYKSKKNKPKPKSEWIKVENTHEAIIKKELWDTVQQMLVEKTKPYVYGNIGVFSRKVKCMHCQYFMRSSKNKNGYTNLRCPTNYVSKLECIGSSIGVKTLEKVVITEIRKLSEKYLDIDKLVIKTELLNEDLRFKLEKYEKNLIDYEQNKINMKNGLKELYVDKIQKIISEEEYIEFSRDFHSNIKKYEKLISEITVKIIGINNEIYGEKDRKAMIKQYINIEYLDRITVDLLIDYILIGNHKPYSKDIPIEIHWKF